MKNMSGPDTQVWIDGKYKANVVWRKWWWPFVKAGIHDDSKMRWFFKSRVTYRGSI